MCQFLILIISPYLSSIFQPCLLHLWFSWFPNLYCPLGITKLQRHQPALSAPSPTPPTTPAVSAPTAPDTPSAPSAPPAGPIFTEVEKTKLKKTVMFLTADPKDKPKAEDFVNRAFRKKVFCMDCMRRKNIRD